MYYKAKENEFLKWEYISCQRMMWSYELCIAEVPPSLVRALQIFKKYYNVYPVLDDPVMAYPTLRLIDDYGRLMHIPYKTYIMRNFNHTTLLDDVKHERWDFTQIDKDNA